MRKKKISVLGRGTAGAQTMAHFVRWMPNCELEWHFDPNTPTQSVGEGSVLSLPANLFYNVNFSYYDMKKIDSTFKTGVYKTGWGKSGETFFHDFTAPKVSLHFNAEKLQNYIFEELKNSVKIVEHKTTAHDIDSDFIIDCSGTPKKFDDYDMSDYICVNSVYVVQCPWEYPRFDYTLTLARPYGWVFGIPLQNRCSIGYMYNKNINTLEEIKEDIKNIFDEYNLNPSEKTNNFSFNSYSKKENFTDRIFYNGNASFFLEPLEATSVGVMDQIQRLSIGLCTGSINTNKANSIYKDFMREIELIIMMHYFAGSKYNTDFWKFAEERGKRCMENVARKDMNFIRMCKESQKYEKLNHCISSNVGEYGVWWLGSFLQNLRGLGIEKDLIGFLENKV